MIKSLQTRIRYLDHHAHSLIDMTFLVWNFQTSIYCFSLYKFPRTKMVFHSLFSPFVYTFSIISHFLNSNLFFCAYFISSLDQMTPFRLKGYLALYLSLNSLFLANHIGLHIFIYQKFIYLTFSFSSFALFLFFLITVHHNFMK